MSLAAGFDWFAAPAPRRIETATLARSPETGRWSLTIAADDEHFTFLFSSALVLPPSRSMRAEALRRLGWAPVGGWRWSEEPALDGGTAELTATARVTPSVLPVETTTQAREAVQGACYAC